MTDEQLKDVVITVSGVTLDDDSCPYAVTRVFRYDLEGGVDEFINAIEEVKGERGKPRLIEGGEMKSE